MGLCRRMKEEALLNVVVHTCNPRALEGEAGMSLRAARSTP